MVIDALVADGEVFLAVFVNIEDEDGGDEDCGNDGHGLFEVKTEEADRGGYHYEGGGNDEIVGALNDESGAVKVVAVIPY